MFPKKIVVRCATVAALTSLASAGDDKSTALFDGKTLEGWSPLPGGTWSVEDGAIVGRSPASEKRHGILLSDGQYADFRVRAKFRVHKGDSGFYFRCEPVAGGVSVHGFQVEVDDSQETGGLYETGGRGWVVKPKPEEIPKKKYRPGEWSDLELTARGGDVVVKINGVETARLTGDRGRTKGHIGLQLHGSMEMHVEFKDISISALSPEETPASAEPGR
jgi:hypothetical protein